MSEIAGSFTEIKETYADETFPTVNGLSELHSAAAEVSADIEGWHEWAAKAAAELTGKETSGS
jgi:hypothetical protein